MKVYLVINNNHDEYEDYHERLVSVFKDRKDAEACVKKCNQEYREELEDYVKEMIEDSDDQLYIDDMKLNMEEEYASEMKYRPARIEEWEVI